MAGMEIYATSRNVRMTPRKVRLVGDALKGKPLDEALALLRFMPHRASTVKSRAPVQSHAGALLNLCASHSGLDSEK